MAPGGTFSSIDPRGIKGRVTSFPKIGSVVVKRINENVIAVYLYRELRYERSNPNIIIITMGIGKLK
jgi:hypothetical protein